MAQFTASLGFLAAICTTLAFVPQVIQTLKTRDVSGISAGMYGVFTVGVFLWLVYGILIGSWPVIAANACTFVLAATVLYLIFRHRRQPDP